MNRYALVNAYSDHVVVRGPYKNMRRLRPIYRVLYQRWGLPFKPDIRPDLRVLA